MPTYDCPRRFLSEHAKLIEADRQRFRDAVDKLVSDLRKGQGPHGVRAGLRCKPVQSLGDAVWEITWAPDGRAMFRVGDELHVGETHIEWLHVGTHSILP